MPLTKWKRPQQLTLWGGYIIPIVYWSARKIKKELEKDPSSPIARDLVDLGALRRGEAELISERARQFLTLVREARAA